MTRGEGLSHIDRLARRGAIYAPEPIHRRRIGPVGLFLIWLALMAAVLACAVGALFVAGIT